MLPGRPVATLAVWAVLLLGTLGAWRLRRSPGPLAILLGPVILAVITSLIAFGYPRFRYAADVPLIVMGAALVEAAVSEGSRQAAERRRLRSSRV
jgi:CHASE2 domain-containing sensor protein